ncbi:unnamed protein product [Alternaria alternata]
MAAVLITGATGKQGGSVVNALLKANSELQILALTRNAQSASAQRLAQKSPKIKLITGNLDTIEDVFNSARQATKLPIWGVFSVQVPMGGGQNAQSEERQGKALVDASLKHGVKHFVSSSVDRGGSRSDKDPTNIPHFISKHNIEQHLFSKVESNSSMNYTVLRPVAFFENLMPNFFGKVFTTSWETTLRRDQKLQLIATSDIGFFAAEAFMKPKEYLNERISIAGDELTYDEFKTIFEEKTGQNLPTTYRLISAAINGMVKELGYMFQWFRDVGYGADIPSLKERNPELKDFKTWLDVENGYKAYKRTKAWHKCRDQHFIDTQSPETIRCLLEKNSDVEFYDTEDEEEHHQRKAEEKADKHLTFYGKLWKEFRNQQSGKIGFDEVKKKDREERRKLAKAVVRELDLRERNKAKNTDKVHSLGTS